MNDELLLLIKKNTDTMNEQTKTKPQETLEFKLNKQVQTFSFNPAINLVEEGKWLLKQPFKAKNSVFDTTDENNSFPITTPGYWNSESTKKTFDELNKLIDLRSENDIELHVEQFRKKGIISINDHSLPYWDYKNLIGRGDDKVYDIEKKREI